MIYIMIYLEPHWILIHETSLLPQSQFFAVQLSCFFLGGRGYPNNPRDPRASVELGQAIDIARTCVPWMPCVSLGCQRWE